MIDFEKSREYIIRRICFQRPWIMTDFNTDEIPLLRLIPVTYRIIELDKYAKNFDLTKSQIFILTALHSHGILNMTKIAEYLSSSKEQATRAVSPLVEKGLVRRIESENNRKVVNIEFTDEGRELIKKLRDEIRMSVGENKTLSDRRGI